MDCDVAIIGGGFAGCGTAWWLARRGIRAVVLERENMLGKYASGRSAGLGRQLAEDDDTTALTVRGANLIRAHAPHAWRQTGGILSFDDAQTLEAYASRAQRFAIPVERLDRAAVLAHWPALGNTIGGLHVPSDGAIDVRALLEELARHATVRFAQRVDAVAPTRTGVRITTATSELEAQFVVDAAGAWAGGTTDARFDVLQRHLFVIEAAPPSGPYVWHIGKTELYARGEGEGTLISPCDATPETPGDSVATPAGEAALRAVLPALATAKISNRWACQRTFAPDRKMRLGRDRERPWLVWAAGLGGHGATAALAAGERVADSIKS